MVRILLPLVLTFFTISNYVYSYCIYNSMTDGTGVGVYQVDGQGIPGKGKTAFSRDSLSAGTKACCPFTKIMCNAAKNRGNRDALAQFEVWVGEKGQNNVHRMDCPVGGYMDVTGSRATGAEIQCYNFERVPVGPKVIG